MMVVVVVLLACRLARALVFFLLMAALSYSHPKCAFVKSKMNAFVTCMCKKLYKKKLQEYYFAVLIYKFLVYVKDKGAESFYYNVKMCWKWL